VVPLRTQSSANCAYAAVAVVRDHDFLRLVLNCPFCVHWVEVAVVILISVSVFVGCTA